MSYLKVSLVSLRCNSNPLASNGAKRRANNRTFFIGWLTALLLSLGLTATDAAPGSMSIITQVGASPAPTPTVPYNYNSIIVTGDQVDYALVGTPGVSAFNVNYTFGGPSTQGSRTAIAANLLLNASPSASSLDNDFIVIYGGANATANSGGTSGSPKGNLFGGNLTAGLASGATYFDEVAGLETDTGILGGSAVVRFGLSSVSNGTGESSNTTYDAAIEIGAAYNAPGSAAWHNGILFSALHGGGLLAPIDGTGCAICTDGTGTTVGTGIDLSPYTISGNALNFQHFSVAGSGTVTALTFGATQSIHNPVVSFPNDVGGTDTTWLGSFGNGNVAGISGNAFAVDAVGTSPGPYFLTVDGSGNVGVLATLKANGCVTAGSGTSVGTAAFCSGSGAPTFAAPNGTLYTRYDSTTVLYVNTSGASTTGTTWTAIAVP